MNIVTTVRRPSVMAALAILVVLLVAIAVWFKPWGLIVNETVAEAAPSPIVSAPTTPSVSAATTPRVTADATPEAARAATTKGPVAVTPGRTVPARALGGLQRTGRFVPGEHEIGGTVRFISTKAGVVLRLEDLRTTNGPDVRVYLSTRANGQVGPGDLQVAPIKANLGSQNYLLTISDVSRYRSVVIWCERFSVGFGHAVLTV